MRLVAGIAGEAVGVIGGDDLRKPSGLRRIRLMAADAKYRGIKFVRRHRCRIVRVFCQWSVTCLAIDVRVLAIFFLFQDVRMAGLASLMARKIHRPGRDFSQSVTPIMPVLSEGFWDEKPAQDKKQEEARDKDSSHSKQVRRILESYSWHPAGY